MPRKAILPDDINRLLDLGQSHLPPDVYCEFRGLVLGINREIHVLKLHIEANDQYATQQSETMEYYRRLKLKLHQSRASLENVLRALDELDIREE